MAEPLVSVVMPVYNMASTLERSINSVLNQTYENIELIVVDDGSTDNIDEVLGKFDFGNLDFVYVRKENGGRASALNASFQLISGKYVALLDADDTLPNISLEKRVDFLENNEYDMVYGDMLIVTKHGKICARRQESHATDFYGQTLYGNVIPFSHMRLMIRSEVIKEIGMLDESIKRAEDIDFLLRVFKNNSVGYLDENVYRYHLDFHNNIKRLKNRVETGIGKLKLTLRELSPPESYFMLGKRALIETSKLFYEAIFPNRIHSLGECFYKRNALGLNEEPIDVYKIKTMVVGADRNDTQELMELDALGKRAANPNEFLQSGPFLRKYWIDEIPQIWSLFKGDLKLVGIRPQGQNYWRCYPEEHKKRALKQKPGLVGIQYAHREGELSNLEIQSRYLDEYETARFPALVDAKYFAKFLGGVLFKGVRSR